MEMNEGLLKKTGYRAKRASENMGLMVFKSS